MSCRALEPTAAWMQSAAKAAGIVAAGPIATAAQRQKSNQQCVCWLIFRYGTRGEAYGPHSIGALGGLLLRPLQDQHSTQLTLQHPSPAPKIRALAAIGLEQLALSGDPVSAGCPALTRPYIGAIGNISKAGGSFSVAAKPVPSLLFLNFRPSRASIARDCHAFQAFCRLDRIPRCRDAASIPLSSPPFFAQPYNLIDRACSTTIVPPPLFAAASSSCCLFDGRPNTQASR